MRKLAIGLVLAAVLAGCASPKVMADAAALPLRPETLRTPDERFANLQGWSYSLQQNAAAGLAVQGGLLVDLEAGG